MGLNRMKSIKVGVHKMLTCDYCFTRYSENDGVYSEDGDYCTQVCLDLDAADRADLYYETMFGSTPEEQAEYRTDLAIDTEREKDL